MADTVEHTELDRKYRVLRQTIGIHAILRDRFHYISLISELSLLVSSVIFCATTFASDKVFTFFGVTPETGTTVLGFASVAAFAATLVLMIVKPNEISERHAESVRIWSKTLAKFRDAWSSEGWDTSKAKSLSRAYWSADDSSAKLPAGTKFTKLKSAYLLNVEVSKAKSEYPGCPRMVIGLILRLSDTYKALKYQARSADDTDVSEQA